MLLGLLYAFGGFLGGQLGGAFFRESVHQRGNYDNSGVGTQVAAVDLNTGPWLNRGAFPIGGIGAGMVCLEGTGCLSHASVFYQTVVGDGVLRLGEVLFGLGDAPGLDETDEVGSGGLPEDVREVGGGQARVLGGFRQGERWIAEFAFGNSEPREPLSRTPERRDRSWLGAGSSSTRIATWNGRRDAWATHIVAQSGVEFWIMLEPAAITLTWDRREMKDRYPKNPLGDYLYQISPDRNAGWYDPTALAAVISPHANRSWFSNVERVTVGDRYQDYRFASTIAPTSVRLIRNIPLTAGGRRCELT